MEGWRAVEANKTEGWGAICGLSSSPLPVPGRGASQLPATGAFAWARHEVLLADFCPVHLPDAHLVADGPLPGSGARIGTPLKMDEGGTMALQLPSVQIQEIWLPIQDPQRLCLPPHGQRELV